MGPVVEVKRESLQITSSKVRIQGYSRGHATIRREDVVVLERLGSVEEDFADVWRDVWSLEKEQRDIGEEVVIFQRIRCQFTSRSARNLGEFPSLVARSHDYQLIEFK